ncbi:MAG: hypothetical protein HYS81_01685 [Candidatus Aenigmatarchaeota archaeon]|nr:MAG: hypothetical protein HYS81_01685 [Candidatus Aenigmarchaeota archaeon]
MNDHMSALHRNQMAAEVAAARAERSVQTERTVGGEIIRAQRQAEAEAAARERRLVDESRRQAAVDAARRQADRDAIQARIDEQKREQERKRRVAEAGDYLGPEQQHLYQLAGGTKQSQDEDRRVREARRRSERGEGRDIPQAPEALGGLFGRAEEEAALEQRRIAAIGQAAGFATAQFAAQRTLGARAARARRAATGGVMRLGRGIKGGAKWVVGKIIPPGGSSRASRYSVEIVEILFGIIISAVLYFVLSRYLGAPWAELFLAGGVLLTLSFVFPSKGQVGVAGLFLRFVGLLLVAMAFSTRQEVITFLILFAAFFAFPQTYLGKDVADRIKPLLRGLFGVAIAAFTFLIFSGGYGLPAITGLSWGMGLMTAGLLISTPQVEGAFLKIRKSPSVLATGAVIAGLGLGTYHLLIIEGALVTSIIFLVMGVVSAYIAWTIDPMERSMVGAPLVIIFIGLLIVGSGTAQQSVGQAAFGVYWPNIQTTLEPISGALRGFGGGTTTLQIGVECLADPIGCQQRFKPQAKTAGTVKAVEIVQMSVLGEQTISRVYSENKVLLEIRNDGTTDAKNIEVTFLKPTLGVKADGELCETTLDCIPKVQCPTGTGRLTGEGVSCTIGNLFPGEPAQMIATYKIDLTKANVEPRGNSVSYKADVAYAYDASSSMDVTLLRSDFYDDLAKNGRLKFTTATSTDTGGPVRIALAIYNNQMPIRAGLDAAPILLQLENQGSGRVTNVASASVNVANLVDRAPENGWGDLNKNLCSTEGYNGEEPELSITAPIESPLEASDPEQTTKRTSCIIPLKDVQVESQTEGLVANVAYVYTQSRTLRANIEFGMGKVCECKAGTNAPNAGAKVTTYGNEDETCKDCQTFCGGKENVQSAPEGSTNEQKASYACG